MCHSDGVVLPTLQTPRLVLRPLRMSDAPLIAELAGTRAVVDTTLNIPYPYRPEMAENWISAHEESFVSGRSVILAITARGLESEVLGAISLQILRAHEHAELGYWLAEPHWNQGYVTEAAQEMIRYGFETLALHRIQSHHFVRNTASGRVMQKIGMRHEGRRREIYKKWGAYEDCDYYGLLRKEYLAQKAEHPA